MTPTDTEYEAIVEQIRTWPATRRFALLHDVLRTLSAERTGKEDGQSPRRSTLAAAIGLGAGGGPPPTDEQVKQWLEERRMEKFG